MFSFKKGRPIAKFINGPNKGRVTLNIIDRGNLKGELGSKIQFESHLIPVPDIINRQVVYIAGPSGSGKSTMAAEYITTFKKAFPDRPIYIFSRKKNDPALDHLNPNWVCIDERMVENPIDITTDIGSDGALVLFDDCATFIDDKIKKAVSKLMADILEVGRSLNIYCVVTSHLINPNERRDGRIILNESHSIVIFPKSGNSHAINYALKTYCGFSKKSIEEILNLPSRWVWISKQYPNYILYSNGAYIV